MTLRIGMVTIDSTDPGALAGFWTEALGARVVHEVGGEFLMLASDDGVLLGLQRVTEAKDGKNRVHLDLRTNDRAAEVRRVVGLGATVVAEHEYPAMAWAVLHDPQGNEFCIGSQGA
ncbi:MAG: VOC family protein [Kutzneria sp.]|nr:VOC family protein [Kutzneria sp.]MBV9847451.1 VOC family protein [Kutzneria sp.]